MNSWAWASRAAGAPARRWRRDHRRRCCRGPTPRTGRSPGTRPRPRGAARRASPSGRRRRRCETVPASTSWKRGIRVGQRRLARSGRTRPAPPRCRPGSSRSTVEHRRTARIGEADASEADLARPPAARVGVGLDRRSRAPRRARPRPGSARPPARGSWAKNQPVIRNGKMSTARYCVKATNSPRVMAPSTTRNPPSHRTATVAIEGITSNSGRRLDVAVPGCTALVVDPSAVRVEPGLLLALLAVGLDDLDAADRLLDDLAEVGEPLLDVERQADDPAGVGGWRRNRTSGRSATPPGRGPGRVRSAPSRPPGTCRCWRW